MLRLGMIFCLLTSMIGQAAWAGAGQPLLDFLEGLQTLKVRFRQQVIANDTNEISYEQGVFYLSRPGRFRWVYEGDYPRYVIADGKTVWLVEEDIEQVSQRAQKNALKGTLAGLLTETKPDLTEAFEVHDLGQRQGLHWLELIPRIEDSPFQHILVAFDGHDLKRLEMADPYGQITRLEFFDFKRNLALPEQLFKFVPPPGYDILDQ